MCFALHGSHSAQIKPYLWCEVDKSCLSVGRFFCRKHWNSEYVSSVWQRYMLLAMKQPAAKHAPVAVLMLVKMYQAGNPMRRFAI